MKLEVVYRRVYEGNNFRQFSNFVKYADFCIINEILIPKNALSYKTKFQVVDRPLYEGNNFYDGRPQKNKQKERKQMKENNTKKMKEQKRKIYLSVDEQMHRDMKIIAGMRGISMQDYMTAVLKKDLYTT